MTSTFLWGAATSAYQIEGAVENDWTAWEAAGRLRVAGERCGEAAGHRSRWRSDLSLLPTIGANAYRFSVEWSRIEPRPGSIDLEALGLEIERVAYLRQLGIEPVVTLHHYTHPRWFVEEGGWENPRSADRFGRFARAVADALGGKVHWWVTLNEPIVFVLGGFLAATLILISFYFSVQLVLICSVVILARAIASRQLPSSDAIQAMTLAVTVAAVSQECSSE